MLLDLGGNPSCDYGVCLTWLRCFPSCCLETLIDKDWSHIVDALIGKDLLLLHTWMHSKRDALVVVLMLEEKKALLLCMFE